MPNGNNRDDQEFLTPGQLAAEWHVSTRTIVRYVADGKLSATKLPSGHLRIRRADAEASVTRLNENRASA
ncbi:helix-turn-helix domain-containing protein [Gordonia terrae]